MPTWGFAAHPLIDGDKLICLVGGEGSIVVAFDTVTGAEKWRSLSMETEQIGYCPPMIYKAAGVRQLVIWHAGGGQQARSRLGQGALVAAVQAQREPVDPDAAARRRSAVRDLILQRGDAAAPNDGGRQAVGDGGVEEQGPRRDPKQTDTLHSIMGTPFIRDGYIYGVCSYGQFRCLKEADGERVWEDLRATGDGAPTSAGPTLFSSPRAAAGCCSTKRAI